MLFTGTAPEPIISARRVVAARRASIVGDYRHPRWLTVVGWIVAASMAGLGAHTIATQLPTFFR